MMRTNPSTGDARVQPSSRAVRSSTSIGSPARRKRRSYAGDGDAARRTARAAIAILEPEGESIELARAYSGLSQLAVLAEQGAEAIAWGERALALATRLGDKRTRAHALVNLGTVGIRPDPDGTAALLEAHAIADAAGERHEATRALLNLAYTQMCWVKPEAALRHARMGLTYAREHEVHTLASLAAAMVAWLRLRAGDWAEAERDARAELEQGMTVPRLLAETVVCELAVRRGDPDAPERLADLVEQADRSGELQRIVPTLELETEWALTRGAPLPIERFRRVIDDIAGTPPIPGWDAPRAAAWASVVGLRVPWDRPASAPQCRHAPARLGERGGRLR